MPLVLETPPKITFGVTECCNLRCRHCYADCAAAPKAGELGVDDWLRIADEVIQDGVIQFYIEGGEPLAKPGFLQLLSRCAHDAMTLLRTNGTLIDQSMAAALKAAGVGRVLVDMMGADAETHEWFTRVPGSFAATCDGIRHSVAAGVSTDVLVILVDFGRVGKIRHSDIWHYNPLYRHLRSGKVEKGCAECSASQGTAGGCRSTAYAYHGRWTAPDPFDEALNDGVDVRVLPDRAVCA